MHISLCHIFWVWFYIRNRYRRLRHLNIWSPVHSTVWAGSEGVALLEEECPWDQALKAYSLALFSTYWISFMLVLEDVSSQFPVSRALPDACCCASHLVLALSEDKRKELLTCLLSGNYLCSLQTLWTTAVNKLKQKIEYCCKKLKRKFLSFGCTIHT